MTAQGGLPALGGGANASLGAGRFVDGSGGVRPGASAGGGAFAVAGSRDASASRSPEPARVFGAYAGASYGLFVTNAASASELAGVGETYAFDVGFGPKVSVQVGVSPGNTYVGSVTVGPGIGLDVSRYATRSLAMPT
ncbi:MAG: hypothetical protein NVS2B3_04620 [Vulcanimicrobiaceae bacterium]